MLIVLAETGNAKSLSIEHEKDVMGKINGGDVVRYRLSDSFPDCLKAENEGGHQLSVSCWDADRGVGIYFVGSRHALDEVSGLVK